MGLMNSEKDFVVGELEKEINKNKSKEQIMKLDREGELSYKLQIIIFLFFYFLRFSLPIAWGSIR